MEDYILSNSYEESQDEIISHIHDAFLFRKDQVLCPMCEVWHFNNSECQRNDLYV